MESIKLTSGSFQVLLPNKNFAVLSGDMSPRS
jgi:hypothetical protein